jgi:hypothetical protein
MKKVKRMMFGGVSKAAGNAARNAAAKAPAPPPMAQKMMANLPRGSTVAGSSVGKSPLDSLKNLPKMSGPLGKVGTTGGQNLPKGMTGLGAALGKPSSVNTTTDADMARKGNAKPFSSVAGSLGMLGGGGAAPANPKIPATINTSRMLTGNPVTKTVRPFGMKEGGKVSSASKRADGCAVKGKTKGKMV